MAYSTDGGATWAFAGGIGAFSYIYRILIDPSNPSVVFAASYWGDIYRSTDGGLNWTVAHNPAGTLRLYDLEFKPGDSNIVYATGQGIMLKSTDNGLTWNTVTTGTWGGGYLMMGVTPNDPNYLYVLEENQGGFGALHLSTNNAASFTVRSSDNANNNNIMGYDLLSKGGQAPRDMDVVVSPTNKNEVHVAGIMTFKSTDTGLNWTQTTHWVISNPLPFIHADVDILIYQGNTLYCGTDGGIFMSKDQGSSFIDRTQGLGIRQLYRIGASQSDPGRVSGGSQDNGTGVLKGGVWYDFMGADGMETFIDFSDADKIYGSVQFGLLYKSTDGGVTAGPTTQTEGGANGDWITPVEQDPSVSGTIYQAKTQLHKSTDEGNTWTAISPALGGGNLAQELALAPSDNQTIYLAYSTSMHVTTNGGATWTAINPSASYSNINYISVHPTNPQRLIVALSGASERYVESTNGGATWTDITYNLPALGANCAIYDGSTDDGIYVGMAPGIYYKDNTSPTSWTLRTNGLPNVDVRELEIACEKLYAGTYGRGLWEASMDNPVDPCNTCTAVVTQTGDSGQGSLREAIDCVNADPVLDMITFNIPGAGPHIINPLSQLPFIVDADVVIDGTTQPGWTMGNIVIDAAGLTGAWGLVALADGFELYGMKVQGFDNGGIGFISNNAIIGEVNKGNVLAGNIGYGMISQESDNVKVYANHIGVLEDGITMAGNGIEGYWGVGSTNVEIGKAGGGNIISANDGPGIYLGLAGYPKDSTYMIHYNYIGTNASGANLGNLGAGVTHEAGTPAENIDIYYNQIAYNDVGIWCFDANNVFWDPYENTYYCNIVDDIAMQSGANNNMQPPVITLAHPSVIEGTAQPNAFIEVRYIDTSCPSMPCQGRTLLGFVNADANGDWMMTGTYTAGASIKATQSVNTTDWTTSAFATCALLDDCPANLFLPNNYANVLDFEVSNIIEADNVISGAGTDVTYDAGNYIELFPDFEVVLGAEFHAFIDGCGNLLTDEEDDELKTKGKEENSRKELLTKNNKGIPLPNIGDKPTRALVPIRLKTMDITFTDTADNEILRTTDYTSLRDAVLYESLAPGTYKVIIKTGNRQQLQWLTIAQE